MNLMTTSSDLPEWHRVENEEQLEDLIRGGYTNFTLRPYGATVYVYITEELFDRGEACLSLPGFELKRPPNWFLFRELLTDVKFNRVCIPGPLTAHELAIMELGKTKRKGILAKDKAQNPRQDHSNLPVADGGFFVSEDEYTDK